MYHNNYRSKSRPGYRYGRKGAKSSAKNLFSTSTSQVEKKNDTSGILPGFVQIVLHQTQFYWICFADIGKGC